MEKQSQTAACGASAVKGGFHYGFVIVACCCLMMGVNIGLSFSCAGIFYKPVSESLGVSVGEFGIYMSIMYVASTLMLPMAGKMIERWSARWLLTGSCALMGLVYLAMSFFNALWEFYAAAAVTGLTLSFLLYLSFPTLVNRWFHTRVGFLIGVCSAASGIGGMIFNPMAASIILSSGWRTAYLVFAAILLVGVTPLLAILLRDYPADKGLRPFGFRESAPGAAPAVTGVEYSKAIRMPVFAALFIFAFLMMGISTLNLFVPSYVSSLSFSFEDSAYAASAVMLGVTLGKLVLGYINDRNCRLGVLVTCLGGAAGLLAMVFGTGSFPLILAGAFCFGWEYAGVTVQTAMLTREVFGSRSYARIYAIISTALALGGAFASGGWGLLSDATSYRFVFVTGAILLVACALIGVISLRKCK